MITALTEWVKYIVFVVLFASFLELLLPNNNLQRFIRLILGLFIMLTILNPLMNLVQTGLLADKITVFAGNSQQSADILDKTAVLVKEREKLSVETYQKELIRQIRSLILSVDGIADANVVLELDDTFTNKQGPDNKLLKAITVYIKPGPEIGKQKISVRIKDTQQIGQLPDTMVQKVANMLSELYQIPREEIKVRLLHS